MFGIGGTKDKTVSDKPAPDVNHIEVIEDDSDPLEISEENEVTSEAVVTHVHQNASKENCHCPIGTCLNPQDEVPPTHPNQ